MRGVAQAEQTKHSRCQKRSSKTQYLVPEENRIVQNGLQKCRFVCFAYFKGFGPRRIHFCPLFWEKTNELSYRMSPMPKSHTFLSPFLSNQKTETRRSSITRYIGTPLGLRAIVLPRTVPRLDSTSSYL